MEITNVKGGDGLQNENVNRIGLRCSSWQAWEKGYRSVGQTL
jgi:hypothetical protein